MRYALIADVHANIEALTAVLAAIDRLRADRILCLGDVVGRFANPNEVVDVLRARGVQTIAGNHDRAAAGTGDDSDFTPRAKRSNAWTRAHVTPTTARFLRKLPALAKVDDHLLMVHAALHPSPNDHVYLTSSDKLTHSLNTLRRGEHGVQLAFFGHTHLPGVHRMWTQGKTAGGLTSSSDAWQKIYPDSVYLINPGSVGQPRDGDRRASFAVYDSDHAFIRFHRAEFDRKASYDKAIQAGLLTRGDEYLE